MAFMCMNDSCGKLGFFASSFVAVDCGDTITLQGMWEVRLLESFGMRERIFDSRVLIVLSIVSNSARRL